MSAPTTSAPPSVVPIPIPIPGRLGRAALALAVVAAALPAVARLYGPGWLVPVGGAVVAAVLVDLLVRLALPKGNAALLVVAQVFAAGLWTSVLVRPALDGATAVGGARDGVARLLSAIPPVDARGPELAAAVVAAWVVTALTAAVLARPRTTLLGAVPAVALFGVALALGDPRSALADRSTALLVAAIGLLLVVAARPPSSAWAASVAGSAEERRVDPARLLRPVTAVVVLAAIIGVAVAVTPSLPGLAERDRVDVRERIDPPVDVLLGENPLDTVAVRRAGRGRPVRFTAEVDLPAGADGRLYWRLTVLDDVGPGGWRRAPAGFVRAGRSLGPPPAGTSEARAVATARIRLGAAPSGLPLLPTLDRPLAVQPSGLAVDPRTGELAVPAGDPRPTEVVLDAAVPTYALADLSGAPAVLVTPPADVPPAVTARASAAAASAGSANDFQRLSALKASVEDDPLLRLDPVRTGNTADATVAALLAPPEPVAPDDPEGEDEDEEADDEPSEGPALRPANAGQVAAAFALLARSQGFDARLVVGYLTPVDGRSPSLRVTDDQLTVWTEVRFEGLGWVPIRVSAPAGGSPDGGAAPPDAEGTSVVDEAAEDQQRERPETPTPDPAPTPEDRAATPPPAADQGGDGRLPLVLAGVVVVLLLLAAVGPALRWRRRTRRRRGDHDQRVLGAWAEALDVLAGSGVAVGTDLTRPDVVAQAQAAAGPELAAELAWLARHADRAAFSVEPPPAGPAPVPSVADRAWLVPGRLAAALAEDRSRWSRLVGRLRWPRRLHATARPARRVPRPDGRRRRPAWS